MDAPLWIDLEGADNARDVGGLPTLDGRRDAAGSAAAPRTACSSLLTPMSGTWSAICGLRAVADLRTDKEVREDGPGPLARESSVRLEHFSLYPEAGVSTDLLAADAFALGLQADGKPGAPVLLPWQERDAAAVDVDDEEERRRGRPASTCGTSTTAATRSSPRCGLSHTPTARRSCIARPERTAPASSSL